MNLIKPEHVSFIFDNKNGTSTVGLINGMRQIMDTPEANLLARAVAQINKVMDKYQREHGITRAVENEKVR